MKDLMSTSEVARMYQVTSAAVLNWIHTGKLKAYTTPGGHYRVAREDLDAFAHQYSPPPASPALPDLRLLLVGSERELFDRLRNAVHFRWPAAQVEHACNEFEIGWWLARLRPSHLVVHPARTPANLLDHCRRVVYNAAEDMHLVELPGGAEDGLGQWINQLNAPASYLMTNGSAR